MNQVDKQYCFFSLYTFSSRLLPQHVTFFMNIINSLGPGIRYVNMLAHSKDHAHQQSRFRSWLIILCFIRLAVGTSLWWGMTNANRVSFTCMPSTLLHTLHIAMLMQAHRNTNITGRSCFIFSIFSLSCRSTAEESTLNKSHTLQKPVYFSPFHHHKY